MKRFFLFLLATSLTANAWLYLREADYAKASTGANAALTPSPNPVPSPQAVSPIARLLATLDRADLDLAKLRDELRAAGVDDSSVRGLLEGALRARYDAQVAAGQIDALRTGWWRRGLSVPGRTGPSSRALVDEPLQALLGRDPLDIADAEARYDFLSPEKRRLLALTDLDYTDLRRKSPQGRTSAATKTELEEQQLLARERQKDVIAALTPDERAEYELRFGGTAARNARRFAAIQVTEGEFRAVKPILDVLDEQRRGKSLGSAEYAGAEQHAVDSIVSAVGYERALDFIWGDDSGPYAKTARLLREASLPPTNAVRLFQLSAETGLKAAAIHDDTSLDADQKRAALAGLQQATRPQLDALVPPALQSKLDPYAFTWFQILGDGRYQIQRPSLIGGGWAIGPEVPVTTAQKGPRPTVPIATAPAR
jgi:hypothetical protein